jgi:predicted DNA-binding transcriptional regulator AlpA
MSKINSSAIQTLKNFESLPSAGFVDLPVVCALFSCSRATVWRRVRQGQLVAPHRIGARTTRWSVGEIRDALASVKA